MTQITYTHKNLNLNEMTFKDVEKIGNRILIFAVAVFTVMALIFWL